MEYWIEGTEEKYIYYYYDESGISGISYCGTEFYFHKNIFGDVIAIYNVNGNLQCTYDYDAWGNHKIYNQNGAEINKSTIHIGNINPIRYRGYYWDSEFSLYYLQSRYYDPTLGRFISPDSVDYLEPQTIGGLNLYAYCGNNPIKYCDPTGHFAITAFGIWAIVGIVSAAVVIGGGAQLASNALAGETGSDLWRGVAGAAIGSGVNALALCLSPFTGGASLAFAAGLGAAVQTGVDTVETLIRGEKVSLWGTALDLGLNFVTTFAGNWIGSKLVPTNAGWFKPQKFLSVFTKPYGQKILLQTVIGAGLSAGVNFVRKFDWSSVDWKKFIPVIPVPVVPTYPYF